VLFDFSLARAPVEHLRVGTPPYLDPFLPLRKLPRWDAAVERYAVVVTLYEMAAGWQVYPRWGDGQSDPALTEGELTIEADRFDPAPVSPIMAVRSYDRRRDVIGLGPHAGSVTHHGRAKL
jgi:hypothetical protein